METQGLGPICAALGVAEEDEYGNRIGYSKGAHCLDNLKDLLRFLRRDDPQSRDVFKQVCKWNIVSNHLIPIIHFYQKDRNLVLNSVKVLVFLTMPIDPSSSDITQQTEYLWGLKSVITNSDVIAVVVSLLEPPLENLEREMLTEDDWKLVQLVLTFFRNVLAIQDFSLVQKIGGSACQLLSLRDRFLEILFQENVMDIVIVITQHVGGRHCYFGHDNLLLLEIFHYIFMGQNVDLIAKACFKDSKGGEDMKTYIDSLKSIMNEEEEKKRLSRQRNMVVHSQYGGTFTRLTMDGSKAVYKGNPSSGARNILLKPQRANRGPTKRIAWDHGILPAKKTILGLLHDLLNQFLSGGYNVLMQSVRDDIEKETQPIQNSDVAVFFQVAQFVISFQYHKFLSSKQNTQRDASQEVNDQNGDNTLFNGDICGPVAASMNESMFLLVLSRWHFAFDGLKETHDYRFLSAAGSLMKTMIRMLDLVLKLLPEDFKEPQTARILLYKLFYDQTEQGMTQFLLSLIKSFDIHKQPKSDLADLVEMIHVIVRLMENLQARGTLRVSKKSRRSKKKEKTHKKEITNDQTAGEARSEDQTALPHMEKSTNLDDLLEKTSENSNSEHNDNNNLVHQTKEHEISVLEIGNCTSNLPKMTDRENENIEYDASCSSDDSSGDEQPPATYEVDFKVSTFISGFASHSMIKNLCWLLAFYKSNTVSANHYTISLLRRITDDLELSSMLYQLSLLTTFYDILEEQKASPCKEHAEIVDFLTSLVRRMLRKMKNQPFLFVELLFWKSRRECHYIDTENLLHELGNIKKKTATWGSASADGEVGPSVTGKWVPRNIRDALGEDEADVVISYDQGDQNGGNTMEDDVLEVPKRKTRFMLTEELESRIKELYEKYKDDKSCYRQIAESLGPDIQVSPAQVSNKLKQLGLTVASKKRSRLVDKPFTTTPDLPGEKQRTLAEDLEESMYPEGSLPSKSMSSKERSHVFDKDQEEMIKTLYQEFKEHRRCSYMIANALSADNSFTAAQVSRKLKQLGLEVPRRKRSKRDTQARKEELTDLGAEVNSDDETLLSLRNRSKSKNGKEVFTGQSPKQIAEQELSGDSDNEVLGSILEKRQKLLLKPKDSKPMMVSRQRKPKHKDSPDDVSSDDARREDGGSLPDPMQPVDGEAHVDSPFNHNAEGGASEGEVAGSANRKRLGVSSIADDDNLLHEDINDELADSEDDAAMGRLEESGPSRRTLRMVLDVEDDD